jgi:hypothetical protein
VLLNLGVLPHRGILHDLVIDLVIGIQDLNTRVA